MIAGAPAGPRGESASRGRGIAVLAFAAPTLLWLAAGCARRPAPPPLPLDEVLVPDSLRSEPVVTLSDSTFWRVLPEGGRNRLERRSVTWHRVNRGHPAVLERIHFHENEILQEEGRIAVEAWYPDRGRWTASERDMQRIRPRPRGLHVEPSGSYRTAVIPRYGEGLVIRIETRDVFTRPEFLSREGLRGDFPCLRRYVAFRAPEGSRFKAALRNREGLAVSADTARADGGVEIRLRAADLPRLLPNRSPRYPEEWYAALHFSVPPEGAESWTWRRLGDHYLGMLQGSLHADAEVRSAATRLRGGDADALSAEAFRLVKSQVRYLGDFRGLNAWVPRAPRKVWENGYGDCKEMANLLRALLAEKGVGGGIALVRSGDGQQLLEEFPALSAFDHAVYWRRRPDGTAAILDATMPGELGAASYLHLLGKKVFLIEAGMSRVDTVRPEPGFRNRIETASTLAPRDGGGWDLRGALRLGGKAAQDLWLPLHFEPDPAAARALVGAFLADRFGLRTREFAWNAPGPDSLEIRFVQAADGMVPAARERALLLDLPRIFDSGLGREEQEGEWRAHPFEQIDTWTLPEGYRQLRHQGLDGSPARGSWTLEDGRVRREFALGAQGNPVFAPEEADRRRSFHATLARFSVATVSR